MGPKKLTQFIKSKLKNPRSDKLLVFLICLALSSFLWLLNSLEKRYTDRISVPIKYIDLPKDKQLTGTLPKRLDLMVDGFGYTLLSHKLRLAFSPVLLNVNDLTDNMLESNRITKYTVYTSAHKEEIEKQISSEIKILSIKPDTISFNFSIITEKLINVKPNVELTFGKDFILQSVPTANPDAIMVRGPKDVLDTMEYVSTERATFKDLTHNIEQKIYLKEIDGLEFTPSKVMLAIPIEQNTEVAFDVPIEIVNQPDTVVVKTFPGKAKVSCRIGLSNYKKLTQGSFKVVANFAGITANNRLPVSLINYPDIVLSVNFSPQEVEYILEKKPQ